MVGAVGRDLHHKPVTAELAHQRGIFPHRVQYANAVIGGEEHVHKLPFPGEGLPGAWHAQIQPVRLFVKRNFSRDGKNQAGKAPWTVKSRFWGWVV